MSYTQRAGNAVDFQDAAGTYTAPAGNAVDFQDESDAPAGSQISVWLGSAWVLKPLKRWDGSAWVNSGVLRHWDGAQWIPPISPITTEQSESLSTEAGDYIIQE